MSDRQRPGFGQPDGGVLVQAAVGVVVTVGLADGAPASGVVVTVGHWSPRRVARTNEDAVRLTAD